MIRTLVSATSLLARAGLASVVRGDSRLLLVAETSPAELERRIDEDDPDVVLEQHDRAKEGVRTASVALVDDPREAWLAAAAGSDTGGYAILSRDASAGEIAGAIVAVAAGLVAVQPRALAASSSGLVPSVAERLTPREVDVLHELARGVPNKTIGARLSISEHTVKFHIASIFAKLGAASRTEAVTQGVRLGLVML